MPSWMRSSRSSPRPMYFLAILTTRRILASARASLAALSPFSILLASDTSSSAVMSDILPISRKYKRTESSAISLILASLVAFSTSSSGSVSQSLSFWSVTSMPLSMSCEYKSSSKSTLSSASGIVAWISCWVTKPCCRPLTISFSIASLKSFVSFGSGVDLAFLGM